METRANRDRVAPIRDLFRQHHDPRSPVETIRLANDALQAGLLHDHPAGLLA